MPSECLECGCDFEMPKWNGKDWILICQHCNHSRYPTDAELKELLNL